MKHAITLYLLFLKINVNVRQTTANTIPTLAKIAYITVSPIDTVTTSSIGIPSLGIPSAQLHIHVYVYTLILCTYSG